jgi:hypothetical protein
MGKTNKSFHLWGKKHVAIANDLFKSMQRGNAHAEAQFFRISGGMLLGPRYYSTTRSQPPQQ